MDDKKNPQETAEAPDRAQKKGKDKTRKTARAERFDEERKKIAADDEIEKALARSAVQKKKGRKKRKKKKWAIIGLVFAIFTWFLIWLFSPLTGTMAYGICRVFLEQNVQYPPHLRLSQVEQFSNWVRIWYIRLDAFGEHRMEPIQCYYRRDEELGYSLLEKVTIRRQEVDREKIEKFNKTIPILLAHPPDLTLPRPLPDTLKNLRFNVNRFIRPIL